MRRTVADHQREFPAQHAAEIVGVDLRPVDHPRQRMDEDVEPEIGGRLPERPQLLGIERRPCSSERDHHAGKAEIDRAALELGGRFRRLERRHMREPDEAPGVIVLRLPARCR